MDYSGFKLNLDLEKPNLVGDFEKIKTSHSNIQTQNALYEKYARHNYLYVSLYFCDQEAKGLIDRINKTLDR